MREILFRRVHFFDEEKTKFSHFSFWGVGYGIKNAAFTSPSSNNFALYHTDEQFTGLTDKNGMKIFEGDVLLPNDSTVEDFNNGDVDKCIVKYDSSLTRFLLEFESIYGGEGYSGESEHDQLVRHVKQGCAVIGSIHDAN